MKYENIGRFEYIKTSSFYLAALMHANNCELLDLEDEGNKKKIFVFKFSPQATGLLRLYNLVTHP